MPDILKLETLSEPELLAIRKVAKELLGRYGDNAENFLFTTPGIDAELKALIKEHINVLRENASLDDVTFVRYAENWDPMYHGQDHARDWLTSPTVGKDRPYSSEQSIGTGRNVPYGKEQPAGPYGAGDQPPRTLDGMVDKEVPDKIKIHVKIDEPLFNKVQSLYRRRYGDTWTINKFWS